MTILIAYDGSDSAETAMTTAWNLLGSRDASAVVLSVWEPLTVQALRALRLGGRLPIPYDDQAEEVDKDSKSQAQRLAELGQHRAGELGFKASARWVADNRSIAEAIAADADELDVDAIVMGARRLTGIAAYLGSMSHHVLEHAHRPVLVVPLHKDVHGESTQ
jgi:nucleotide-binding universal stress UspA family protein